MARAALAEDWIDTNQLGRRNLTPDQASLLRGRRYLRAKKDHGGDRGNQHTAPSGQNVHLPERTAERLGAQHGVTERTIRRDGDFAAAVETLKPHVPDIEQRVMAGDVPSKAAVIEAANIVRDGCRDPLVVWEGVLLDGHNRYDICRDYGIHFETVEIELPDRDAAEDWIDTNQLGRRNLTPDQASFLRGRRYNRAKKPQGAPLGNENRSIQSGQNVHIEHPPERTAERLATQHGVTERTIRRDGQFADAVETLKPYVPDIEQRVMAGDVPSKAQPRRRCP